MKSARIIFFAVIATLAIACSDDPSTDNNVNSWDLDAGSDPDVSITPDVSGEDAAGDTDGDGEEDAGEPDTGDDDEDTSQSTMRTLSDYRQCDSDLDCPVGLGSCIKQVSLNRPDIDGTEMVALDEIFEDLEPGRGVCTEVCTDSPEVCEGLSVNGSISDPVDHTCQLVVVGAPPYPEEMPDFPFDDQIDPDEMLAGQPFGAICRAPFELDEDVSDSFCSVCTGSEDCGPDALCWDFLHEVPSDGPPGLCLTSCQDDSECPMGFACDVEDDQEQTYCRPMLDTCTNCQDVDGNGFGTGRCATGAQAVTPYDCDDRNPDAYYFPADMEHPFPEHCSDQDLNCNGINDRDEQVGPESYGAEHCTGCFMSCEGPLDNGVRSCMQAEDDTPFCGAECETDADGNPLFANCDGDLSTGCEVPIDDPSRLYYRDADGDGFGDPNHVIFACDPDEVPEGYVDNDYDCNDDSDVSWGGPNPAPEICDGIDNNCDGTIDEGIDQVGQPCSTGEPGVCDEGVWECHGFDGMVCVGLIEPGSQEEVCNGEDTNCDGTIDTDGAIGSTAFYPDQDGDGFGDMHAEPRMACSQPAGYVDNNLDCDDSDPLVNPDADEICGDGIDNNCDGNIDDETAVDAQTWYRDADGDGFGDPNVSVVACEQPDGYVDNDLDCDDTRADVNPDETEICNLVDNSCSGTIDDVTGDEATTFYRDADGDTYGDPNNTIEGCMPAPDGYVTRAGDCNDSDPDVNPDALEICDGIDNNCDGNVDHGCPHGWVVKDGNVSTRNLLGNTNGSSTTNICGGNRFWASARVELQPNSWPVQKLDIGCRNFETEADTSTTPYSYDTIHTSGFNWLQGPGGGGQVNYETNSASCSAGEGIYKVTINYDALIQNITFHCRGYNVNGSGTSFTLDAGPETSAYNMGGSTSGTNISESCSGNQIAVGATIHQGTYFFNARHWNTVYGIELKCQDIDIRRIE